MIQGIRPEPFDMAFAVAQFIHQAISSTGFLVVCHVELGKDALLGIGFFNQSPDNLPIAFGNRN